MKEKLYTIPLNDAFNANDECPLCYIDRSLEQDAIDFVLGSGASYMESDIREDTDKTGFCRHHLKMMYDYGNSLGNALILKTHIRRMNAELFKEMDNFKLTKSVGFPSLLGKSLNKSAGTDVTHNNVSEFIKAKEQSCYVCNYYKNTYERYIDTFFYLYKNDAEFVEKIKNSKGFCLHHLNDILIAAESKLNKDQQEKFFPLIFDITKNNMSRIDEDISWFVDKFDYRNKDADWKNSKDAIPRTMQKLHGGYPSDLPYKA